jgi:hypothetical protein
MDKNMKVQTPDKRQASDNHNMPTVVNQSRSDELAQRFFESVSNANSQNNRTRELFGVALPDRSERRTEVHQQLISRRTFQEPTARESQAQLTLQERTQTELDEARKKKDIEENEEQEIQAECYRLLRTSDYGAHRFRYPTAVPGTCQWLLHHEKYRDWRLKESSDLLWLSADPGCGKSVLTSYLIDHLKNTENRLRVPEIVCYFFFKEDSNEQNNAIHALCAVLHQLYTAQPLLLKHVTRPFAQHGPELLRQFSLLWDLLDASTTDPTSRDIIFVFDGLDECEPVTRNQLLQSLTRFYGAQGSSLTDPPFVKTIIASRPNNEIKVAFDVLPTIRLRGEDEPEAISEDVELVIEHHIENAVRRGLPRSILADVRAGLIKGADRTFLWTTLVIDLLEAKKGASKRELMEILQARGDIFRIYDRLLENSSDPEQARKLLNIVIGAVRPLTLDELSIAMAVNQDQSTFEELELDVVHNFEERAKALCGNFIRIVRSTVYLVHQTAREFLLEQRNTASSSEPSQQVLETQTLGQWRNSVTVRQAHHQLLNICLQYLSLLNVRPSSQSIAEVLYRESFAAKFLDYAGRYWTLHYLELAPGLTKGQLSACVKLCNANTPGFSRWFSKASESARNPEHKVREGTTKRDIAYVLGLSEVVALLDRIVKPEDLDYPKKAGDSSLGVEDGAEGKDDTCYCRIAL